MQFVEISMERFLSMPQIEFLQFQLVVNIYLDDIVVESDCLEVVEASRGNITRHQLVSIVYDINDLKRRITRC